MFVLMKDQLSSATVWLELRLWAELSSTQRLDHAVKHLSVLGPVYF